MFKYSEFGSKPPHAYMAKICGNGAYMALTCENPETVKQKNKKNKIITERNERTAIQEKEKNSSIWRESVEASCKLTHPRELRECFAEQNKRADAILFIELVFVSKEQKSLPIERRE